MGIPKSQSQSGTDTKERSRTKHPRMFQVILLNDNYTSMEFVVLILETIFHKNVAEAQKIMFAVHQKGAGVAGLFTKEVAETKVAVVHQLARQNQFPLKCTMEPV